MFKKFHSQSDGFTIVELMVVIVIIGVLAAIALPRYNLYRSQSFISMTRSDAKNAHTALIGWITENAKTSLSPVTVTGPGTLPTYGASQISPGVTIDISDTGDVRASHQYLAGDYQILFNGAIMIDSLAVP
jgi:type IV pilus assembly protein PilA